MKCLHLVVFLILSSCSGYRCLNAPECKPISVSVPLIRDDPKGALRDEIVRQLTSSGKFIYSPVNSEFSLIVEVKEDDTEHIGYQYDRHPIDGTLINRLVANEGKREVSICASLQDTRTCKAIIPSFKVGTSSVYNFVNPVSLQNIEFVTASQEVDTVLNFSLGQLDSEEGAKSVSFLPIYKELASKIMRVLVMTI